MTLHKNATDLSIYRTRNHIGMKTSTIPRRSESGEGRGEVTKANGVKLIPVIVRYQLRYQSMDASGRAAASNLHELQKERQQLLRRDPPDATILTSTMNGLANGKLDQLPDEMFSIIKATSESLSPRLARLSIPGRRIIDTPHYLAVTSRGVVPHITQDTFRRDTSINAVYIALEDCKCRHRPYPPPTCLER